MEPIRIAKARKAMVIIHASQSIGGTLGAELPRVSGFMPSVLTAFSLLILLKAGEETRTLDLLHGNFAFIIMPTLFVGSDAIPAQSFSANSDNF